MHVSQAELHMRSCTARVGGRVGPIAGREAGYAVPLGARADRGSRARRLQTTHMDAAEVRPEQTPNGAHMDIGAHGDLSTLHWVQSEPSAHPDFLSCEVTYGAAAAAPPPAAAQTRAADRPSAYQSPRLLMPERLALAC